jgi:hypothetical protein
MRGRFHQQCGFLSQLGIVVAVMAVGALLGLTVRWIAVLVHDARTAWRPAAVIGALFGLAVALAWQHVSSILLRARLSKVTLQLGGSGIDVTLDPDSAEELWRFFIQMVSRIATRPLAPGDGLIEEALTSLYTLFDRARADLGARPPRGALLSGTVAPHIYVLDVLNEDLRPCTARWHGRFEIWKRTGRPESEWPLAQACRDDIEVTRQRTVERAWQLGESLGIAGLDRLLPPRPAAIPNFTAAAELQKLEADAGRPEGQDALKAGWRIYVETTTRIATQELPAGAGLLGEAIASLYTLTGKIRDELASLPPSSALAAPVGIAALGIRLINEGLRPFLAEWHPRYDAFKILGQPEASWDEADECRVALADARQRCLAIVAVLAQRIGVPLPDGRAGPS